MGVRDLEIARAVKLRPIQEIAETLGLGLDDLELYGRFKAKVRWEAIARASGRPDGALVLVTAMTPTPAGEGKSTTTVGLADGCRKLRRRAIVALREPSLGPVFGVKGGAAGGGYAQLAPMEDINLHFTGDMHAIGAAHNLLAAMLDNHLAQGNALGIDTRRVALKRVVDMNDRALRNIVLGLGGPAHGVPREGGFEITVASEVMAIKCRTAGLVPAAAVVVATVRALKMHAGVALTELPVEDVAAVRRGCDNLAKHVENVRLFGLAPVVALNHFTGDTDAEVAAVLETCRGWGVPAEISRGWAEGGAGTTDLAQMVLDTIKGADRTAFRFLYPDDLPLERKIEVIATQVYGAAEVRLQPAAAQKLARWQTMGHGRLPVCMAKTQNSLSDDPKKTGRPRGFTLTVRDARLCAGAGFVVAYAGDVLTMPGLPKVPGAEGMDVDATGHVTGLF